MASLFLTTKRPTIWHKSVNFCRCSDKGISLHKDKLKFCESKITFDGLKLSREGFKVDDSLLNAIHDFPLPTNVTNLRYFFGLANQLSNNTATIAQCLQSLRPLLSTMPAAKKTFPVIFQQTMTKNKE